MAIRTVAHLSQGVNAFDFRHGLALSRGERMLKIHVWESKSSWRTRTMQEKQALTRRLTSLVNLNLSDEARKDGGPYLVHQGQDALLIWTIETDSTQLPVEYENIGLIEDFVPLTFVSASKTMTAKTLAERLAN